MKTGFIHEERPWGWFTTIGHGSDYKVKKIYVNPNSRFSLQYHKGREEHWTIVAGSGLLTLEDDERKVVPGEYIFIPKKAVHRMEGGPDGILFIEVQRGICKEDDIVRLKDDYGRG